MNNEKHKKSKDKKHNQNKDQMNIPEDEGEHTDDGSFGMNNLLDELDIEE